MKVYVGYVVRRSARDILLLVVTYAVIALRIASGGADRWLNYATGGALLITGYVMWGAGAIATWKTRRR